MPKGPKGFTNDTGARRSTTKLLAAVRNRRFFRAYPSVQDVGRTEPSPTVRLPRDPQQTGHIP